MRRSRTNHGIELFGPGTDVTLSLFAIMVCVFTFVLMKNFRLEGELNGQGTLSAEVAELRKELDALKIKHAQYVEAFSEINRLLNPDDSDDLVNVDPHRSLFGSRRLPVRLVSTPLVMMPQASDQDMDDGPNTAEHTDSESIDDPQEVVEAVKEVLVQRDESTKLTRQLSGQIRILNDLIKELKKEISELQKQNAIDKKTIQELNQKIEDLKKKRELDNEKERLIRQDVLGLKGNLDRVVFVVDKSESMGNSNRWKQAIGLINNWVTNLPVKEATLILFDNNVYADHRGFTKMNVPANRRRLVEVLNEVKPAGRTATLDALKKAYRIQGVQTIILFTDGKPDQGVKSTEELVSEILNFVSTNRSRKITINTIGLGDYFDDIDSTKDGQSQTFRLLVELAEITGGSFRGR